VQYIQNCKPTDYLHVDLSRWVSKNTINKAEIEKIKNNHKGIDAEGRRRAVVDMPKGVCMCGHHIWKVGTSLIHQLSGCEVILIKAC